MLWHATDTIFPSAVFQLPSTSIIVKAILFLTSKPPKGVSHGACSAVCLSAEISFYFSIYSRVVCRLPRELGACVNSVYQALFPPPPPQSGNEARITSQFMQKPTEEPLKGGNSCCLATTQYTVPRGSLFNTPTHLVLKWYKWFVDTTSPTTCCIVL